MTAGLKSALTLSVLALLVVVATLWGWSALTEPLPVEEEVPICRDTKVTAGTEVRREQVVVSVFNGSKRSGLAGATSGDLEERGFVPGKVGDAPDMVGTSQIWTSEPDSPAVLLVRKQFKKAKIVEGEALGPGVVVVVGGKFKALRTKQVESVVAESDSTFCEATGSQ